MDFLTNREWAVVIWVLGFALFAGRKQTVRNAFGGVLRALFNKHILIFLTLLLLYVVGCVSLLWHAGLWHLDQLKTTSIWFVFSAVAASVRAVGNDSIDNLFVAWLKDTFKILVLIEFLATNFSFSIWIELIVVPLATIITLMSVMAERNPDHKRVKFLLDGILIALGVFLLIRGVYLSFQNWDSVGQLSTMRDIYTPPLLALVLIPFSYVIFLYARYEQALVRLRFTIPDPKLRDYAMGIALVIFGPRTHLLQRWTRSMGAKKPSNKADVLVSMREVIKMHKREKSLPAVDPALGWCPVRAGAYLKDRELQTNDYHKLDDEWFASAGPLELNDAPMPDNIAYYVEGDEETATTLRLALNVNSDQDPESSEIHLLSSLQDLIRAATDYHPMFVELQNARSDLQKIELGGAVLRWELNSYRHDRYRLAAIIEKLGSELRF